jgi:hypothetical protein
MIFVILSAGTFVRIFKVQGVELVLPTDKPLIGWEEGRREEEGEEE